MVVALKNEGLK